MRDDRPPGSPAQLQQYISDRGSGLDQLVGSSYEFRGRTPTPRECDWRVPQSRIMSDADSLAVRPSYNSSDVYGRGKASQWLNPASDSSTISDFDSPNSEAPSLITAGSTIDASIVPTDRASDVTGFPLLDEDGVPTQNAYAKAYECPFPYLECNFSADNEEEYKSHSLSHFFLKRRGYAVEPPRNLKCPLCSWEIDDTHLFKDGWQAWDARMDHVAMHHQQGNSLASSRPDFAFFSWLRRNLLIDKPTWRQLMDLHAVRKPETPVVTPKASPHPVVVVESSSRGRRERDRFRGRRV